MEPLLAGNAEVLVRWGTRMPRRGEIVVVASAEGLMLVHRAIDVRTGRVLQAADRFSFRDTYAGSWLPADQVFGLVEAVRAGGRAVSLETRRARLAGALVAASSRLLWALGKPADADRPREPLRRSLFYAARALHLLVVHAAVLALRRGRP